MDPLTNGSYWGPVGEEPVMIMFETTALASDFLNAILFGMTFIIYLACMRVLWRDKAGRSSGTGSTHRRSLHQYVLMGYMSLVISFMLILMVITHYVEQLAYVNFRNFPMGVFGYYNATSNSAINVVSIFMFVFSNIFSDVLLLWRCRVVWKASLGNGYYNYVMIFPTLVALASISWGLIFAASTADPNAFLTKPWVPKVAIIYFSLTLSLNVILTALISLRIWSYQRTCRESLGEEHCRHYTSLSTMFLESAAAYTIISIGLVATFAIGSPANQIFLALAPGVQTISSFIIIWRVANRRAWADDTLQHSTLVFVSQNSDVYNKHGSKSEMISPTDSDPSRSGFGRDHLSSQETGQYVTNWA